MKFDQDPAGTWFDIARDVVQAEYPHLPIADPATGRIGSSWQAFARNGIPGQRRATVYRDNRFLAIVVEVRFLQVPWSGEATWGTPRPDQRLEDRLARQLEAALGTTAP